MNFKCKRFNFLNVLVLISLLLLCAGCGNGSAHSEKKGRNSYRITPIQRLEIGKDFYYWEADESSTVNDAIENFQNFKKLEDKKENNLMNMFGNKKRFVWIRADFMIPQEFKYLPLGLVIPQLRSAEKLYCNGTFVSQYGSFPPNERFTQFMAHFFSLPVSILNQNGTNTILIKVFIHGNSGISTHAFIQPSTQAYPAFERINFYHSRVFAVLFGVMFFTFILYLCFYLNLRKFGFVVYRDFSLLNLFTALFLMYFFATELPFYTEGRIPFLIFAKYTFIIPGYLIIYMIVRFGTRFFGAKPSFPVRLGRNIIVLIQILMTVFAPDYDFLLDISPAMMTLVGIQLVSGILELIIHIIKRETRAKAIIFAIGFAPFATGGILDAVTRVLNPTNSITYFMIFGWQGTIMAFVIMLAYRFGRLYQRNDKLTNHLQEEVDARTEELRKANDELSVLNRQLEIAKLHSDMDLEMAFSVQKNFFPQPVKHFRGWELAVSYIPQAKVSGDLYDYYSYNDILNGIALFDVSGHGLSAGLVTMLSKNIISRLFQRGYRNREPIDKILTKINSTIIYEKGDIDNYMTGILCRFENLEGTDTCLVDLGNAGHPHPLKFSITDKDVKEVLGIDGKKHYGAIGMKGIDVSFASSSFVMKTGDILVFFTDGISETSDKRGEQFGTERIKAILKENYEKSAQEINDAIIDSLIRFAEGNALQDDITLVIARRVDPKEEVSDEQFEEDTEALVEELKSVD